MEIKAIDRSTVHRICSGQVIVSLAIAVKELVENALDAGATVIEVKLKEHGSQLIEVSDNGQGVTPNNFQGLTFKHHTSKIRDFADIVGVETFGFRGEALSSLCALCELSISTRHATQECGSNLLFDFTGKLIKNVPIARQIGTTVSLTNIFSTLPVRHKEFRRNLTKEFNKMLQLLYAYGLVSSGVRISCTNQTSKGHKSVVFATNGSSNVKDNVACIFGSKQVFGMQQLSTVLPSDEILNDLKVDEAACSIFKLDGLISSCAHNSGRGAPDRQFYFINSRPCEPHKISRTVNDVYHQYNLHQYPFVFLNITVARGSMDVNVTPDKRQIFLDNEKLLISIVKASLENTYRSTPSTFVVSDIAKTIKGCTGSPSVKTEFSKPRESSVIQTKPSHDSSKRKHEETDVHHAAKVLKISTNLLDKPSQEINEVAVKKMHVEKMTTTSSFSREFHEVEVVMETCDTNQPAVVKGSQMKAHVEMTSLICDEEGPKVIRNNLHHSPTDIIDEEKPYISDVTSTVTCSLDLPMSESPPADVLTFKYEDSNSHSPVESGLVNVDLSSVKFDAYEEKDTNHITVSVGIKEIRDLSTKRFQKVWTLNKVLFRSAIDPSKNSEAEDELQRVISKDFFKQMEIIGQFNLGFIIAKLEKDLFIIDQHASDEKFNFETLQKSTIITNQKLVVPQPLELTTAYQTILMDNLEIFKKNGFEFNFKEDAEPTKKVTMIAVPLSVNRVFGKEDVEELLFMLQESHDNSTTCRPSGIRAMFASRACRKSVMVGTSLSHADMKKLVSQMGTMDHPWNCPHGRPTMRHLVNTELVKKMRSTSCQ